MVDVNTAKLRVFWYGLATAFMALAFATSAVQAATRPPNIVFVIADQWRAEAFGFAGNPDIKTPNLDRLQREGVRFVNAVAGLPVCSPTRASILTGQRPLTHGVFLNDVPLNPEAVTIAKVLRAAGYDTGYIGKWHVDGHGRSEFIPRERRQGFDESIRVPLLLHWPKGLGVRARQLDAPINSEDLMPTLLGLCGLPIPKSVEGLDYSGCLRGGENPGDGATVILCAAPFEEWMRRNGGKEYRGLRTTRYTYVRDLNGPWLLYDNRTDPYQTNNLANQPKYSRLQSRLDATLSRKLKERHDDFLPGDIYIKQWGYQVDANGTAPYKP